MASPGIGKLSTDNVLSSFDASICDGTALAVPILARQSEMYKIKTMSSLSAGPLISKFRKREFARKRSIVSSMISACWGSADCICKDQRIETEIKKALRT